MKASGLAWTLLLFVVIALIVAMRLHVKSPQTRSLSAGTAVADHLPEELPPRTAISQPLSATNVISPKPTATETPVEPSVVTSNKLDRLAQIRETFRKLAAGDRLNAIRAAKLIADGNERETALLTLVAEWTQGELSNPRLRAQRIANFGLEAGLGLELAGNPELALLWADELTSGGGRAALVQAAAGNLVNSDPAAAFALSAQFPEAERRRFLDDLFADWASHDTDAALKWAEQYPDAAARDAALQAIRTSAPVGIGAVLSAEEGGYPLIRDLMLGMPAERSGQLQVGDRIIAIAQGNGAFMDLNQAPLEQVVNAIRGAPNTMLQLKVVPADAAPNTSPKTVIIVRDQIKFKR